MLFCKITVTMPTGVARREAAKQCQSNLAIDNYYILRMIYSNDDTDACDFDNSIST